MVLDRVLQLEVYGKLSAAAVGTKVVEVVKAK